MGLWLWSLISAQAPATVLDETSCCSLKCQGPEAAQNNCPYLLAVLMASRRSAVRCGAHTGSHTAAAFQATNSHCHLLGHFSLPVSCRCSWPPTALTSWTLRCCAPGE